MAFEARIIVVEHKNTKAFQDMVMNVMNEVLVSDFFLAIDKELTLEEYMRIGNKKPDNRYIRIKRRVNGQEEELKVKYRNKTFSEYVTDNKYFFVSFSTYKKYTIIWFNFSRGLIKGLNGFTGIYKYITMRLSEIYKTVAIYMYTASISRNEALYMLFSNRRLVSEETGKSSLTVLKNETGIDINNCMDNVDNNIAIFFAPFDYGVITRQIYEYEQRSKDLKDSFKDNTIPDHSTGENMVEKFVDENDQFYATLCSTLEVIKNAMIADSIGTVRFYALKDITSSISPALLNEYILNKRRRTNDCSF